ncbi:hypothetical protein HQN89_22930 [Paenibacillus frigoriresistens]|uniref:hypothetical protein n=1 Tax=Paenibacillus alginolyticus TaxID=59839 RepID=UPI00156798F9|nr:hypothetical protein [Paenibacillus frigoriresistens]NRF93798.1 hypothetical protein [Paenibacillus frigoriresistens]
MEAIQQKLHLKPRNDMWGPMAQDAQVQCTDTYCDNGYERCLYHATLLYDGKEPKEVFPHWALWVDPAHAEINMMQTNIKDYIDKNALQFVTGAKSLDKDWDAYVNGLDDLKVKQYVQFMQVALNFSTINKK